MNHPHHQMRAPCPVRFPPSVHFARALVTRYGRSRFLAGFSSRLVASRHEAPVGTQMTRRWKALDLLFHMAPRSRSGPNHSLIIKHASPAHEFTQSASGCFSRTSVEFFCDVTFSPTQKAHGLCRGVYAIRGFLGLMNGAERRRCDSRAALSARVRSDGPVTERESQR